MQFKLLFIFLFFFSSLQAIDTQKSRWIPIVFNDFTFFIQYKGNVLTISDVKVSEITTNSAKVSWALNEYATGQIEYGETINYGSFNVKETSFKYNAHTQPLHNLKPNTTYHYRIISEDKDGNKVVSKDAVFTTLSLPLVISNVNISKITANTVEVSWSLDDYATGQVEYGETIDYGDFTTKEESFNYDKHIQKISNLAPNTIYHYRIISENQEGNEVISEDKTFKTLASGTTNQNIYYVTTQGNNKNNGKTEATAWRDISYAAKQAQAGDTVYIKAGTYDNDEHVIVKHSGTATQPIIFQGYKDNPNIRPIFSGNYNPNKLTLGLDSKIMPLLDGKDRSVGIGISIQDKHHIIFRDIQIKSYHTAIEISGKISAYNIVDHIIGESFGDPFEKVRYATGLGIVINNKAHNNSIKNSVLLNATGIAFTLTNANKNVIDSCKSFANDTRNKKIAAQDYYFVINGYDNNITNSTAEKKDINIGHGGHGFSIKYFGERNIIKNCISKYLSDPFSFRGAKVKHNTFNHITAMGSGKIRFGFGVTFRDGTSENSVTDYTADGILHAITFWDSTEENGSQYSGYNNSIKNATFKNIIQSFFMYKASDVVESKGMPDANRYDNIIFEGKGKTSLYENQNSNVGKNIFSQCSFYNIPRKLVPPYGKVKKMYDTKDIFQNSKKIINTTFIKN